MHQNSGRGQFISLFLMEPLIVLVDHGHFVTTIFSQTIAFWTPQKTMYLKFISWAAGNKL